ncbi:MAG: hypothetical protein COT81_00395 [Candidatus Buchananbacteria bacterium CG10_big_fil_rev_8_21_14_0_10_42_9]|uniref:PNPLA domain-containing protein n=1 Tax=Candidatus Buchananbacteria bacterium CG10_big_fil_rev_8_21_14_0_10_42_9 TaxID=1974526 RepID=A0A2H0W2N9_9BACT|nr:MAG: hypothetical protein COT81_00395 [Candidatus Buchananbacteria bacterium CG10_big_fil_rev_8_21_14_0_10_42_9]
MSINKKIGLALSGGFIKGISHFGVIDVLLENGVPIDMISGCSAGGIVASVYSCGNHDELRDYLLSASGKEWLEVVFEPQLSRKGLLKGERIKEFYKKFILGKTFAETDIPLFLAAASLTRKKEVFLNSGSVLDAMMACLVTPGIFSVTNHQGDYLVDGAVYNQVPTKPLYAHGANYVIAVDVGNKIGYTIRALSYLKKYVKRLKREREDVTAEEIIQWEEHMHFLQGIIRNMQMFVDSYTNGYLENYKANVIIKPSVNYVQRWDIRKIRELYQHGRMAAEAKMPQIKRDLNLND